jgi:hypothetical protein
LIFPQYELARRMLLSFSMFTALTVLAAGTFVALVVRRLKFDIEQENEFRSKLNSIPSMPRNFLQQS